jgi:hypothetical protein
MTAHLLIVDDGRPGKGFWRIFPDGSVGEVTILMSKAEAEATKPYPGLRVEHLQNVEPYEVMEYRKCSECDGKGWIECLCIYEAQRGEGYDSCVGRFRGADLDDVRSLKRGQHVGEGVWDCDECGCDGLVLAGTGKYVSRSELVTWRAA